MVPLDDREKAMLFAHPDAIPVGVYFLPAAWMKYREALTEITLRHPSLFGPKRDGEIDYDAVGGTYASGAHQDPWGYVWTNIMAGCDAFVTGHPIPERAMVNSYTPPPPGAGVPHGFMFLRLTYLRGYEEMMVDFGEEPPELQRLIDLVLDYNLGEIANDLAKKPRMMGFGDDLGTQTALPISPACWRKYLKPCFAKMYGLCHDAGAWVYMHTDGHILPIIPDLVECGVNVINPQIRANGLAGLVATCKGKVCLNLDLDRQMFPFGTPADIDAHVREVVAALGSPEGGLWLTAECGPDVPLANIEAICQAVERYRGYFA